MERREPEAGVPGLAEYADGFVAWLGGLGYSPRTCEAQVALLRHLAGWLAQQGVPLAGLSSEVAGEYAAVKRDRVQLRSGRALRPVLSPARPCRKASAPRRRRSSSRSCGRPRAGCGTSR